MPLSRLQTGTWSPAPGPQFLPPPEFITEHSVGALSSTNFSGLHGFPRRDDKCARKRGVIYQSALYCNGFTRRLIFNKETYYLTL